MKIKEENLRLWNKIKHKFNTDLLEESKLNRQLEIVNKWSNNKGLGYLEACTG